MKLRQWYAIHGKVETSPHPIEMLESLKPKVPELDYDFEIIDGQWRKGCLRMADAVNPTILVHRWRPGEEGFLGGIYVEAWEEYLNALPSEPHREDILRHLRGVEQTITVMPLGRLTIGSSRLARICEQLCGCLARASEGLIQVHQEGYFSPEGDSLFPCHPRHRLKTR